MIHCEYEYDLLHRMATLSQLAFAEDMPDGDVTARVLKLNTRKAKARIFTREDISMCGTLWAPTVLTAYLHFSPDELTLKTHHEDGARVAKGETLFSLQGDVSAIVAVERTLLNFLARGIGIAQLTYAHVAAVRKFNNHTQILDTRKTQPGYRLFDKYAVLCGGGRNHRMNLSDQVLIKENHIARLEGVSQAMQYVQNHLDREVSVQIEVTNLMQLQQALAAKCPLIMLDNFSPEMVAEACKLDRGNSLLEVSGGVNLDNIGDYAKYCPDRISIGAVTHSIKAPDLSLLIEEEKN